MRCCSCFSKNQLESASLLLAVWLAPNTVVIPTCSRQVCHSSVCHPVFLNDSQNLSRLFHCLVINVRSNDFVSLSCFFLSVNTLFCFSFKQLVYINSSSSICQHFFKINYSSKRRRRDLNPRAAINDLHPFQGCPFGQLGYFSE